MISYRYAHYLKAKAGSDIEATRAKRKNEIVNYISPCQEED